ncbi:hypothetical protein H8E88_05155 [candidate division KSB1 bacterium]|nr:hypothetical protein [candidate division KSB1 bacterium]
MEEIKIVEGFTTSDLYRAAAIICETGIMPDKLIPSPSNKQKYFKIFLFWEDRSNLKIRELESKKMKVEPLKFKEIHRNLIYQVRDVIDNYNNKGKRNGKEKINS